MTPCPTDSIADAHQAAEQLLAAELPSLVGLPERSVPRQPNVVDLLLLCEKFHQGRDLGLDLCEALRLAAAEVFVSMEAAEA